MLVRKKMKKSKLIIMSVIIIVVIAVIVFLFFNYSNRQFNPLSPLGLNNNEPINVASKLNSSFDLDFLTKKPYSNLKESASLPVRVNDSEKGRTNPFREINFFITE